jgi:copper chaperone NosL
MVTRRRFLALAGGAGVLAGGVALGISLLPEGDTSDGSGPPQVRYGETKCDTCGMIIADRRFAAGWREPGGNVAVFDDIGCMLKLKQRENPPAGTAFFVQDYSAESWLDAVSAHYVSSTAIKSPMAYGLAAFASQAGSAALSASAGGREYDWVGVIGAMQERG